MSDKFLIVGLGNPGRKYARTRHNVGFWVVDALAKRYQLPQFTQERKALTTSGLIKNKPVILALPQTYMNLSGEAVRALVDYYKIDLKRLIIVHDDLDIALGTLRLRKTGGHGGQNGMRDIIKHLGTKDFARVRFGIGRPAGKMKVRDYVLTQFHGDDVMLAQQVMETAADAIEKWLVDGIDIAMSQYNGDVNDVDETPQNDPTADLQIAERAHELNPRDPKPLAQMIRLYKRLRRLDDAVRAHLKLAEVFRQQGNMTQTIREWEQAARVRPELIELREEIAIAHEEQENSKRAVQTWLGLADYHEQAGDMDNAIAAVDEALRLNPQHPKALEVQRALRQRLTT